MARKAITAPRLSSWEEVDQGLRRIGEIDRAVSKAEAAMNRRIDQLKAEYAEQVKPLQDEKAGLEKDVKDFAESRRGEFSAVRSKELHFGRVGFRHSVKLVIHNVENTVAAIYRIFGQARAEDYLNIKTAPDREALKALPDSDLAPLGVTRKQADEFGYEVKAESL